jgi:hypothetical protein
MGAMLFIQSAVDNMPLLDVGRKWLSPPQGGRTGSMTHASVTIQITPESKPAMPSWMGEVAAFAHILTHKGILTAIQEQVQFARARFGIYDLIDFVAVLIGYILSGEPTLLAYNARLTPFAEPFMALFGRNHLPHRSTLSRFLAALDQPTVEALRTLFRHPICLRALRFLLPVACLIGREPSFW